MEWLEGGERGKGGGLKVEGRGEEMEEERVRIKGNGHYLHRSRLTILHRPSRSRPSPTTIPELGWNSRLRSFVRSSWSGQKRMGIHPSMVENGGS